VVAVAVAITALFLVVEVANAASRRGRRRSAFHGHLPNFCCYLAAGQPFLPRDAL